jgi:magnesium chelatase family protein
MLAQRLPSILPPMSLAESLDVTKLYSVAGLLGAKPRLVVERPFRAPHHTISEVALVGGGSIPKPGEISLAHHGVLFLDELPEFRRGALEVMRQPIEEGSVTIARAAGTFAYPARFTLIASMNPCPCGMRGTRDGDCRCDDAIVAKYVAKLSGPLIDRIDLQIEVGRVSYGEMTDYVPAEPSSAIRSRVVAARERQGLRYAELGIGSNAELAPAQVRHFCALDDAGAAVLRDACLKRQFSARAFDRIARVARTIADLAGAATIAREHVAEAIRYRSLERLGSRRVA